jgi:hypothetical protein
MKDPPETRQVEPSVVAQRSAMVADCCDDLARSSEKFDVAEFPSGGLVQLVGPDAIPGNRVTSLN